MKKSAIDVLTLLMCAMYEMRLYARANNMEMTDKEMNDVVQE